MPILEDITNLEKLILEKMCEHLCVRVCLCVCVWIKLFTSQQLCRYSLVYSPSHLESGLSPVFDVQALPVPLKCETRYHDFILSTKCPQLSTVIFSHFSLTFLLKSFQAITGLYLYFHWWNRNWDFWSLSKVEVVFSPI